jgi:hypothetical protein
MKVFVTLTNTWSTTLKSILIIVTLLNQGLIIHPVIPLPVCY